MAVKVKTREIKVSASFFIIDIITIDSLQKHIEEKNGTYKSTENKF